MLFAHFEETLLPHSLSSPRESLSVSVIIELVCVHEINAEDKFFPQTLNDKKFVCKLLLPDLEWEGEPTPDIEILISGPFEPVSFVD